MENSKRIEFGEFNSAGLLTASVNYYQKSYLNLIFCHQ